MKTPPQALVFVVRLLLPRVYRDHVLGDLEERYRSPAGYAVDGANAIAAAIAGQIRRTTPARFLLLELLLVYASFWIPAYLGRNGAPGFYGPPESSQLSLITLLVMCGLLWHHAYGLKSPTRSRLRLISMLRRAARYRRRHHRWKLYWATESGIDLFGPIYFSLGVAWIWQAAFPASHLFPPIMPLQQGIWYCWVSVGLLRACIELTRKTRLRSTF